MVPNMPVTACHGYQRGQGGRPIVPIMALVVAHSTAVVMFSLKAELTAGTSASLMYWIREGSKHTFSSPICVQLSSSAIPWEEIATA